MDDKGFKGTYKPPSIIAEKKARRQLLANGHTNPFNLTHHEVRKPAEIETNEILNPVYRQFPPFGLLELVGPVSRGHSHGAGRAGQSAGQRERLPPPPPATPDLPRAGVRVEHVAVRRFSSPTCLPPKVSDFPKQQVAS